MWSAKLTSEHKARSSPFPLHVPPQVVQDEVCGRRQLSLFLGKKSCTRELQRDLCLARQQTTLRTRSDSVLTRSWIRNHSSAIPTKQSAWLHVRHGRVGKFPDEKRALHRGLADCGPRASASPDCAPRFAPEPGLTQPNKRRQSRACEPCQGCSSTQSSRQHNIPVPAAHPAATSMVTGSGEPHDASRHR